MTWRLYRDPVFDEVLAMQRRELGCKGCQRSLLLSDDRVICSVGKKFPRCKGRFNGYEPREDV